MSGSSTDMSSMTMLAEEADRQRRLADAHLQAARDARQRGLNVEQGENGEKVVRDLLTCLEPEGWRTLHGRHWPGTRRADLDHVVVGPGGVVVLDSKTWRGEVAVRGGRLWRGQADASEEVEKLVDQVAAVEAVVAEQGLAPAAVTGGAVFVGQSRRVVQLGRIHLLGHTALLRWLRALPRRLDAEAVSQLVTHLDGALAQLPDVKPVAVVRPRPRPRGVGLDQAELFPTAELDLDELERASLLPLEQWMVYLHPSQLACVRREHRGPSRVRGPAGCGKTVVALHRAAYLAQREPGELLVLSYVRTLPQVLATLFARLAPHAADRVTFRSVHGAALDVLAAAGVAPRLDMKLAATCFNRAWTRVGRAHLDQAELPVSYWRDEVLSVIKGRGLDDFASYASLARTGRRTPLSADQRRHVWDLFMEYEALLAEKRVRDLPDIVALALEVVRAGSAKTYRFVFVDEAQDLDLQSVRLAAALAPEQRDGLTLVGDGQQSLYAGGYTLKEAGISVVGRSTVLDVNYRNTRQILAAAAELVRADDFDDLEDLAESGSRHMTALRDGGKVLEVTAVDPASALVALVARLQHDLALGLEPADAAVLCRTRGEASAARRALVEAGLDVLALEDYDGSSVTAIKVGTVKRAKGLEFRRVYLPRVDSYQLEDGSADRELALRERRELFVGMTRARDGLWMCRVRSASRPDPAFGELESSDRGAGSPADPVNGEAPAVRPTT